MTSHCAVPIAAPHTASAAPEMRVAMNTASVDLTTPYWGCPIALAMVPAIAPPTAKPIRSPAPSEPADPVRPLLVHELPRPSSSELADRLSHLHIWKEPSYERKR